MSELGSRRRRGRSGPLLIAGGAVLITVLLAWTFMHGRTGVDPSRSAPDIYTVPKGDLSIRLVEAATLAAAKSVDIKSELEGNHTVIYLIPEGAKVKAGDKLVELDASDLVERKSSQEIAYEKAKADYEQAEQNYQIQKNQNESDTQVALNNVLYGELDLEKFLGKLKDDDTREMGEQLQEVKAAEAEIQLAQEELKRAQDKLEWSVKLQAKGFVTRTEMEADELALKKRRIDLELAQNKLDLLQKYTHVKTLKQRHAILEEAKAELERVKLRCIAKLVQEEASRRSKKSTFNLESEKFEKIKDQIKKALIVAPGPGLVVYATFGDGGRRGRAQMIEEGMQVRERQTMIILPDVGSMIAMASIHESQIEKVREGQLAIVKVDAVGGADFPARVSRRAVLPDSSQNFMSPEIKVYRTEITLEGDTASLRPGMSASVDILVKDLKDVTYAPFHAVQRAGKVSYVWVVGDAEPTVRKVKIGLHNDRFIHIVEGVKEGERILLSVPTSLPTPVFDEETKGKKDGDGPVADAGAGRGPEAKNTDGSAAPDRAGPGKGTHMNGDSGVPADGEAETQRPRRSPGGGPGGGASSPAWTAFLDKVKAKFPELADKLAGGRGLRDPEVKAAIDSDEELKAERAKLMQGMGTRGPRSGGGPGGSGGEAVTPAGGKTDGARDH